MSDESPPPRDRARPISMVLIGLTVLLWILVWAQYLVVVPRAKRLFDEFGMKLPTLTLWTFTVSGWALDYWWIVFPAVLAMAVGAVWLVIGFRSRPGFARIAIVFALLAIVVLTALNLLVAGSLLLPWLKLQEGLAK